MFTQVQGRIGFFAKGLLPQSILGNLTPSDTLEFSNKSSGLGETKSSIGSSLNSLLNSLSAWSLHVGIHEVALN